MMPRTALLVGSSFHQPLNVKAPAAVTGAAEEAKVGQYWWFSAAPS